MMAASSGFTGASTGRSDSSSAFPGTQETSNSSNDAADDEFGSFAAAERLSDPFGDVYGAEADFGDFVGGSGGMEQTAAQYSAADSSSLMSFSPLTAPAATTAPPTLLPSISGEIDPFADITGGLGAAVDGGEKEEKTTGDPRSSGGDTTGGRVAAAPISTSSATSAILDLVWGNTSQETELNPLSTSVGSASGGVSKTASSRSGFVLPPPPPTKFATFPSAATSTPEASTGDLLSFSPVQASASIDPFFGIDNDTSETSAAAPAFGSDDQFTLTATPPLSTTSSSAPTSLRGSFASLHDDVKTPELSPSTPGSVEVKASPRDPFAERTTRSFGSLSASFVSVGAMEDTAGQNGVHASFSAFSSATPESSTIAIATQSPSSAPPSLRSSFKMTDGFVGFAPAADESDEVDPFAEAGLAAPEEVPLAEALAAWKTAAEPVVGEDGKEDREGVSTEEEDVADKQELTAGEANDDLGTASAVEKKSDILDAIDLTKPAETEAGSLDAWTIATERNDDEALDGSFTKEQQTVDVPTIYFPVTAVESGAVVGQEFAPFNESMDPFPTKEDGENAVNLNINENENEVHGPGLQDNAFGDNESEGDEDDTPITASDEVVWPVEQSSVDVNEVPFERSPTGTLSFTTTTVDANVESADQVPDTGNDVADESSSLHHGEINSSPTSPATAPADLPVSSDESDEDFAVATTKKESQTQPTETDDGDDFGDFGGFEAVVPPTATASTIPDAAPWGSFSSPTPVQTMPIEDDDDEFGDFAVSAPSSTVADAVSDSVADDSLGDFAQSTEPSGDDEFGDFGDFEQSSANIGDDFTDFQQSNAEAFGGDDNGFGDFTAPTPVAAPALSVPSFSKTELSAFFEGAFPTQPLPTSSLDQPESPTDVKDTDIIQEPSMDFIQDVFRSMWDEYISIVAATSRQSSSSSGSLSSAPEPNDSGERVRLDRKTTRASKYLKYVLSEKIQEASRQNGIFPHGSERHEMYVGIAASGDADRMRDALKELQDALFHNSVNDAMMRIAKQAALSAKAKIAEQAAQQQASSRGGSLFSTTRQLLSRGGNTGGAHGASSSGTDSKPDHAGADTPTGASVQKLARFSFTNSHDDSTNGHRGVNNGDERGSDGSDHTGHSSGSDSEAASSADSRTRSQTLSNSGSSNGGLMKKFQDRFSFASSRHRPRVVSLRRKGQSGEEVRKMELNLDAISGGLDEVKWKCAMFLYDVEEVAHVAPSQISILAYPSKQPLTGKTDRSALTKLVKPDTIWTVDIGANNSDMLNEW